MAVMVMDCPLRKGPSFVNSPKKNDGVNHYILVYYNDHDCNDNTNVDCIVFVIVHHILCS